MIIWLLLHGKKDVKTESDAERQKEQKTKELGEVQARVLPEPVPSVTEHTTRTFEPMYRVLIAAPGQLNCRRRFLLEQAA